MDAKTMTFTASQLKINNNQK